MSKKDLEIKDWDVVDYLDSEDMARAYLNECAKSEDPKILISAIGDVARAYGMGKIAKQANVNRESLYKSLSKEGNPSFITVVSVLNALGIALEFTYDYQK